MLLLFKDRNLQPRLCATVIFGSDESLKIIISPLLCCEHHSGLSNGKAKLDSWDPGVENAPSTMKNIPRILSAVTHDILQSLRIPKNGI